MHLEPRLWAFTEGLRLRIGWAVLVGLVAVGLGVARLAMLGWLIGQVFAGRDLTSLVWPIVLIAAVMVLRGAFEHWRIMVAHETAARVQKRLRRAIYDRVAALGPGTVARRRSGAVTLSLVDGVEQLETYFGRYIPQLLISLLTPVLIFTVVAFVDLPVAAVMLAFALLALFAPALWHGLEVRKALDQQRAYASFAAEFLDSIQGLATLKAFGQSKARADALEVKATTLFRETMWVLATNVASRGITDSAIACGAAAALAVGAVRVDAGAMELTSLLIILMLGVEIFRPMRELRTVLHQGMVGRSAAQGIYQLLDDRPLVTDAEPAPLAAPLVPTVTFSGVRFRYPGGRRDVHRGLDFELESGGRIGIVGPSGGGKSSIVRLLLRFYDPDEGSVSIGGHDLRRLSFEQIRSMISVVNQDTFLFHGTIEDNLRIGRPDATVAEISDAARAANIHDFVTSLEHGYRTIIGEKGIKLSGGQRQRVAIARALLRDTPILVLDEALSAVDAENEAIIGQALDRLMHGRTTLIIAHRLSSVIDCDRILVLDDGRIVESGPHDALMAAGGAYATLMSEQARESAAETIDQAAPGPGSGAEGDGLGAGLAIGSSGDSVAGAIKPVTEGIVAADGLGWGRLVVELLKLATSWKGRLTAAFVFGVLRVVAFIAVGALSALVVLALKNGEPFGHWLVALAVVAPLSGILHWLESWVAHDMAFRLLAEMRINAFRKLDALAPAYLVRRRTGDLMALATHDIELVEYFFAHTIAPAFVAVLVPAVVLVVLAAQSPLMAVALVPFLAAVGLSPLLLRRRVDRLGSEAREAAGELGAYAVDSVQGLAEIVAFQHEDGRGAGLDALTERHIALRLPFFRELTLQQSLLEVLTGLGGLAVVVTGAALSARGAIDAGILPLLTLLAMAAFLPVSEIAQIGRQLADTLGATRRIYALANEPVPVADGPGTDGHGAAQSGPVSLALEGVGFAYPGQNREALCGVDIEIEAGRVAALVGTSGAGKTTTALLLMRFWDPDRGRVTMNGVDLRTYRLDALRQRIALVAQDTYLFNDTLRANITIGRPEASDAELAVAIDHASLGDLVDGLPDGVDTVVGERGTSLSGGQRQRVAIARAFLKDAPVLILDEATSHLDAVNEQALRRSLERLQADRTTVVIAHRLSTVRHADLIVVLDEGRVVETGTHESLLAGNGLYAKLVSRQLATAKAAP
ncbi:MAG: ABC transporter ATP-binding protein/permease [Acidimicrobiia bacterium]|nr:ABC transporter ATP-binding protein/permease [Acidimicrobiia bacterium]